MTNFCLPTALFLQLLHWKGDQPWRQWSCIHCQESSGSSCLLVLSGLLVPVWDINTLVHWRVGTAIHTSLRPSARNLQTYTSYSPIVGKKRASVSRESRQQIFAENPEIPACIA